MLFQLQRGHLVYLKLKHDPTSTFRKNTLSANDHVYIVDLESHLKRAIHKEQRRWNSLDRCWNLIGLFFINSRHESWSGNWITKIGVMSPLRKSRLRTTSTSRSPLRNGYYFDGHRFECTWLRSRHDFECKFEVISLAWGCECFSKFTSQPGMGRYLYLRQFFKDKDSSKNLSR
jgi:hypothetical protein